ncbi:MAG: flagellar motor protein MotB [Granulosicoccus sp.]
MEDDECPECEEGLPAWMATFADLMSLLMCFFVLLLSFSEMDVQKYKQVAGSMKLAFGVQRQIKADDIPKGTSVVKQEFSPGPPDPSIIKRIQQETVENVQIPEARLDAIEELLSKIEAQLEDEIEAEVLEVFGTEYGVMIRVREQDAFPSGSAELQTPFLPVLEKLVNVFEDTEGKIIVAGHTDNVPISTNTYPSNWVLSSARSAAVVHYLSTLKLTDPARIEIRAYADTRPVVENSTSENRARNRRVEININLPDGEDQ